MKQYFFTILMCLSVATAIPAVWNKLIFSKIEFSLTDDTESLLPDHDTSTVSTEHTDSEINVGETASKETHTEETTVNDPATNDTETVTTELIEEKSFTTVDNTYWADALFIGDSRTMGLSEYADLGGAHVFASSGMNVYKIFSEKLAASGNGKQTLEELLSTYTYGKVYIMLGINELGYDFERSVDKYKEMLTTIQTYQPDAIIFLQANLHVTEKQSSSDPLFNNPAIDRMNEEIAALADNKTLFYIDVNVLFDDEQGNLSTDYAGDAAHIYGKYYAQWADWLLTKGIVHSSHKP